MQTGTSGNVTVAYSSPAWAAPAGGVIVSTYDYYVYQPGGGVVLASSTNPNGWALPARAVGSGGGPGTFPVTPPPGATPGTYVLAYNYAGYAAGTFPVTTAPPSGPLARPHGTGGLGWLLGGSMQIPASDPLAPPRSSATSGSATATASMSEAGGWATTATFTLTGLPAGVVAAFGPPVLDFADCAAGGLAKVLIALAIWETGGVRPDQTGTWAQGGPMTFLATLTDANGVSVGAGGGTFGLVGGPSDSVRVWLMGAQASSDSAQLMVCPLPYNR